MLVSCKSRDVKEVPEPEVMGLNLLVGPQVAILLILGCGCLLVCSVQALA